MVSYQKVLIVGERVAVSSCGRRVVRVSSDRGPEGHVGILTTPINCFKCRRLVKSVLPSPLAD